MATGQSGHLHRLGVKAFLRALGGNPPKKHSHRGGQPAPILHALLQRLKLANGQRISNKELIDWLYYGADGGPESAPSLIRVAVYRLRLKGHIIHCQLGGRSGVSWYTYGGYFPGYRLSPPEKWPSRLATTRPSLGRKSLHEQEATQRQTDPTPSHPGSKEEKAA
jgi:hypothetical protein